MAYFLKMKEKTIKILKELLYLEQMVIKGTHNETLLEFSSIFKINLYEILDVFAEKRYLSLFNQVEEIDENIDFPLISEENSIFMIENIQEIFPLKMKIEENFKKFDYFLISSKEHQFAIMLAKEKEVMNKDFLIFKKEIFCFFLLFIENFRKKKFEQQLRNFLNEILKKQKIVEIIILISEFLHSNFKKGFKLNINVYNQKTKNILIDKQIHKYEVSFSRKIFKKGLFLQ